ncbi:MAG: hypothetical protein RQ745_06195 [Longimicrobiales bacterium]|nr:hypothetical protein [Longimicrobiales bacterium]
MTILTTRAWVVGGLAFLVGFTAAPPAAAQSSGRVTAVVAGYGTANYGGTFADEYAHDFSTTISPIFLFGIGEDLLFESEFEFGLEGGETTTALEYAQIDYLGFERLQFSFGKFLLPFGTFGERTHPSWINKMPTMPLLYGHAHEGVAEGALLPVLADLGFMGRANFPAGRGRHFDLSVYVTQGPMAVEEFGGTEGTTAGPAHSVTRGILAAPGHDDPPTGTVGAEPGLFDIPRVAFGITTTDNNQNKMVGARLGFVATPGFEVYVSGFHAMYDEDDFLDLKGGNVSVEYRQRGTEVRGEAVALHQEFQNDDAWDTFKQYGYYFQAARRIGNLEPVVRWSQLLDGEVDDVVARQGREEFSLGVIYWVSPSVPLKIAYSIDPDSDNRTFVQWAFGF